MSVDWGILKKRGLPFGGPVMTSHHQIPDHNKSTKASAPSERSFACGPSCTAAANEIGSLTFDSWPAAGRWGISLIISFCVWPDELPWEGGVKIGQSRSLLFSQIALMRCGCVLKERMYSMAPTIFC